jgi:hypothetical protein
MACSTPSPRVLLAWRLAVTHTGGGHRPKNGYANGISSPTAMFEAAHLEGLRRRFWYKAVSAFSFFCSELTTLWQYRRNVTGTLCAGNSIEKEASRWKRSYLHIGGGMLFIYIYPIHNRDLQRLQQKLFATLVTHASWPGHVVIRFGTKYVHVTVWFCVWRLCMVTPGTRHIQSDGGCGSLPNASSRSLLRRRRRRRLVEERPAAPRPPACKDVKFAHV